MIYLDHHATTPIDPDALAAMLPMLTDHFANAGSITHEAGRAVAEVVDQARHELAMLLGATEDELVITSGATESNNLALFGTCLHPRQKRRKIVSLLSEHKAVLDPLRRLEQSGFEVVLLPVSDRTCSQPGRVDLERLHTALDDNTAIVSVMLANNEIGTVQPLREIAEMCHARGALLHTDATQAVGRMPIDVDTLDVDLLSFSAHKFYGPKGVGGLYVRSRERRIKLQGQIVGGGQQQNLRAGTMNSAGLVGMTAALRKCYQLNDWVEHPTAVGEEQTRIAGLRDRLYKAIQSGLELVQLNGPQLEIPETAAGWTRLAGNLNLCFYPIEGQSLMLENPGLAMSSGSACTSADPRPSHVLEAIGLNVEESRSSLRLGIGRFNTAQEIDAAAEMLVTAAHKLRKLL
ncbi:MAG: cysteine desulfurase family protein [Pirellulaceae bacterium]|nr:cysteine desulfurase family protein [Pirellulaceae bacterium]